MVCCLNNITVAMQNYLEIIFDLSKESKDGGVRMSDVATKMSVAKASVSNAIAVLVENGYITAEKYQDIHITDKGAQTAEFLFRRHSIIKALFKDVIGIDEKSADDDACAIEHIISIKSIEKIEEFLKKNKL